MEVEAGSATKAPKLVKGTDFLAWKDRFDQYVKYQVAKMWVCIQDGYIPPTTEFEGREQLKKYNKMEDDEKMTDDVESKALANVTMALPQDILHTFKKYKSARELWEELENHFEGNVGNRNSKTKLLKTQFSVFKHFQNESLDEIITRYYHLMTELINYSIKYTEMEIVEKIIDALPP
ncbi:uncharacterized protein LOC143557940 [Bidens hawaiensis]|uniref:uncharacterized protein LOC143557940 n=1 Tax=Bidens hawaiensis TaxID=980011 RepID=UPI00404A0D95